MEYLGIPRTSRAVRLISVALTAVVTMLVALGLAGSASASTASLDSSKMLYYTAATNETNNVTVSVSGSNLVLSEASPYMTSETGPCTLQLPTLMTCPLSAVNRVYIRLYDKNDQFVNNTASIYGAVYGGTGNDTITGLDSLIPGSYETLRGEDGNDTLNGRAGYDTLLGGAGNDTLDGGADSDHMWGEAGIDTVSYATRTEGFDINLTTGTASGPNDEYDDWNIDIEYAKSGSGDDTITGSNLGTLSKIWAGAGNDFVNAGSVPIEAYGQAGHDEMTGSTGDDRLYGNDGDDYLNGYDGSDYMLGQNGDDHIVASVDSDRVTGGLGGDFLDYNAELNDLEINTASGLVTDLEDPNSIQDEMNDVFEVIWAGKGNDWIDISGDGVATDLSCEAGLDHYRVDAGDYADPNSCDVVWLP